MKFDLPSWLLVLMVWLGLAVYKSSPPMWAYRLAFALMFLGVLVGWGAHLLFVMKGCKR